MNLKIYRNQGDGGAGSGAGGSAGAGDTSGGAAGGNAGGAGSGGGAGASNGTSTSGAGSVDWTSGLSDELKGYVANKAFKDPIQVLEAYKNLEGYHGVPADRLIKLPKDPSDPSWGEVFKKLGQPDKADDYAIPAPKEGGDESFMKAARTMFHKAGLTKKQAETLAVEWNNHFGAQAQAASEASALATQQAETALKAKWGQAYEQNTEVVERTAEKFGMNKDQLLALRQAMGPAAAMEFVYNLGKGLGEDQFVTGQGAAGGGVKTPAAAQAEIDMLMNDSTFMSSLMAENAEAKQRWERLHQMAYPTEQSA